MEIKEVETNIIHFLAVNILSENVSFDAQSTLSDLGIDSFSIVEIILFIERKYGAIVPDSLLVPENFTTIHAIAKMVVLLKK
jgi:acyl carrier protein